MRVFILSICTFLSQATYSAIDDKAKEALLREVAVGLWKSGNVAQAIEYAKSDPGYYMARGRSRFDRGDFEGSIYSLDLYMELVGENPIALLVRGLAKQRTMPENIQGACTDFLSLESSGFDISVLDGIETYCALQPSWFGR